MRNGGPDGHPRQKLGVKVGDVLFLRYVVYGVVEEGYQTRDADNGEGLTGEQTENHGRQSRGEQRFVDTEEAAGVSLHVEDEG